MKSNADETVRQCLPSSRLETPLSENLTASPSAVLGPGAEASGKTERIEELIGRVNAYPDVVARELLQECLQALLTLYGDGLARVLQLARNEANGEKFCQALSSDKLVSGLLLVHGLHPLDLKTRLEQALDKVRPYMHSHGGDVQLIRLEDDVAQLRLEGSCHGCPSSTVTMDLALRHAIQEACPDLARFEVEGA